MNATEIEIFALSSIGELLAEMGNAEQARQHFVSAVAIAQEIDSPLAQARIHAKLAASFHAGGDLGKAETHARQGRKLGASINEASIVAQLDTLLEKIASSGATP